MSPTEVLLTTEAQKQGTSYTLAVSGVKDLSGNLIAADTKSTWTSRVIRPGGLEFQYWGDMSHPDWFIDGSFPFEPRFPDHPDWTGYTTSFDSFDIITDNFHSGFGARMKGWVTPAETGSYRFFVRSIDTTRLFLSTDDTEANKKAIAEEPACCNPFVEPDSTQTSAPIALVAGKSYYVELLLKVSWGMDFGQVAWRKEGDKTPAAALPPIPGQYLSAAVPVEGVTRALFDTPVIYPGGFSVIGKNIPTGRWDSPSFSASADRIAAPDGLTVIHIDGLQPWTIGNTTWTLDGVVITPEISKGGGTLRATYKPPMAWASGSTHNLTVTHPDPQGGSKSDSMQFTVASYVQDRTRAHLGSLRGGASFTQDGGGHSGKPGDYAVDLGHGGGGQNLYFADVKFLNATTADDEISFSIWQKMNGTEDFGPPFLINSASGLGIGTTAGDSMNFFTANCCDAASNLSGDISALPGYSGSRSWWTNWHHLVFTRKLSHKQIWVDGALLKEGETGMALGSDLFDMILGAWDARWGTLEGQLDDFAIFDKALTESQVKALYSGTEPGSVPGTPGLLAHWDFNDPPGAAAVAPKLSLRRSGPGSLQVISDPQPLPAGYVLEAAPTIVGPWSAVPNATLPLFVPIGPSGQFLRARRP